MLDPLSAIGLASSIAQLIELSAKFLDQASEIRHKGSSVDVRHLKLLTIDLLGLQEALQNQPKPHAIHEDDPLIKEQEALYPEQTLEKLAEECMEIGEDLVKLLNRLTLEHKGGKWSSVRAALLTIWNKDKIDTLAKQLDRYKSELSLRVLTLLSTKSDKHSSTIGTRLDLLDQRSSDIVQIVSINQSILEKVFAAREELVGTDSTTAALGCKKHSGYDLDIHSEGSASSENHAKRRRKRKASKGGRALIATHRHDETIAAILTSKDGSIRTLTSDRPKNINKDWKSYDRGHEISQTSTTFQSTKSSNFLLEDYSLVPEIILNCLYFRQITDRIEDVADAHRATFGWVHEDSFNAASEVWSNLINWLEGGGGCYWINGKAGSGKSTLMKYIYHHTSTRQALKKWAGDDTLVTASFFFWNLGSSLQKSQEGLLRSLLYDVLSNYQYLIPSVFPGLCRAVVADKDIDLSAPSFAELRKALSSLVSHADSIKICFFIDGIDEYAGDHGQLLDLLGKLALSKNVKLLVSSRPINSCIHAFSRCPTLRLQDLTYDDISRYVALTLGSHANMQKLIDREGLAAADLLDEISRKASGVFLWVMLAVKSLIEGLQNHDRVTDLWQRLNQLPADLELLYQHMLKNMLLMYRQQASCFFQIVLRSTEVQEEWPLTLLQLSHAEEVDALAVLEQPMRELLAIEVADRYEATQGRLRSRCCGLIKVQERLGRAGLCHNVGFLHKTVAEFLRNEMVWADIVGLTANTSFDCNVALLSSCLSELKFTADRSRLDFHGFHQSKLLHSLVYARLAEETTKRPQTRLLEELDGVFSKRFKSGERESTTWPVEFTNFRSFLPLAVDAGLSLYIEDRLQNDPSLVESRISSDLLHQALDDFLNRSCQIPSSNFADILISLVRHGTNPNRSADWSDENVRTPWEIILDRASKLTQAPGEFYNDFAAGGHNMLFVDVSQAFLRAGADNTAFSREIRGERKSAFEVFHALFHTPILQRSKVYITPLAHDTKFRDAWTTIENLMSEKAA